jgi:hypothetical protein
MVINHTNSKTTPQLLPVTPAPHPIRSNMQLSCTTSSSLSTSLLTECHASYTSSLRSNSSVRLHTLRPQASLQVEELYRSRSTRICSPCTTGVTSGTGGGWYNTHSSRTVTSMYVLQVMCLLPRTQCQCAMRTNDMVTDSSASRHP